MLSPFSGLIQLHSCRRFRRMYQVLPKRQCRWYGHIDRNRHPVGTSLVIFCPLKDLHDQLVYSPLSQAKSGTACQNKSLSYGTRKLITVGPVTWRCRKPAESFKRNFNLYSSITRHHKCPLLRVVPLTICHISKGFYTLKLGTYRIFKISVRRHFSHWELNVILSHRPQIP